MSSDTEFRDWIAYEPTWLIIGSILVATIIAWYVFVFVFTRKKVQRSLQTLKPKPYIPPDLGLLKNKYLQLINEVESAHQSGSYSTRKCHQQLSYLLRMFAYEIRGHRVDTLTLDDLRKTRYTELAKAIDMFYIPEFAKIDQGDASSALSTARKVINEWN